MKQAATEMVHVDLLTYIHISSLFVKYSPSKTTIGPNKWGAKYHLQLHQWEYFDPEIKRRRMQQVHHFQGFPGNQLTMMCPRSWTLTIVMLTEVLYEPHLSKTARGIPRRCQSRRTNCSNILARISCELRKCTFWLAESEMASMSSILPRKITSSVPSRNR